MQLIENSNLKLYHGTTRTRMQEVLKNGFESTGRYLGAPVDGRWVMLTDKKEEAERYANSYCTKPFLTYEEAVAHLTSDLKKSFLPNQHNIPALLTVNLSEFNLLTHDAYTSAGDFYSVKGLYEAKRNFDGMLSCKNVFDEVGHNYYVIFNIEKLNRLILEKKAVFEELVYTEN